MSVSSIYHDSVNTCCHESIYTLHTVGSNTHACCHTETSERIFACIRFVLSLSDVLVCDKSDKFAVGIHHRKFFNFVFLKNFRCLVEIGRGRSGYQMVAGHHFINFSIHIFFKSQITVGNDTNELFVFIHHRNTSDVILTHNMKSIEHLRTSLNGNRVVDHTIFCTLHRMHLAGLLLDGHVFVNDTDTALAGNGNSQRRLSDGVHCSRHEWYIKGDVTREFGVKIYVVGQHFRIRGNQEDIIKSESIHLYTISNK